MEIVIQTLLTIEKLGIKHDKEFPPYGDFTYKFICSPKVVIVGLNPSDESPDNSAFHPSTKSGKTVREWLKDSICLVAYTNLSDYKNKQEKPLRSRLYVTDSIRLYKGAGYKIVACGSIVHEVLRDYGYEHFYMPHPSGLNRFWNDKKAGEAKIQEMLEWINKT